MGRSEHLLLNLLHLLVRCFRNWGWIESPQRALVPLPSRTSSLHSRQSARMITETQDACRWSQHGEPYWNRSDGWSPLRSPRH